MKEGKPVRAVVERLRRGEDELNRLNQIVRENGGFVECRDVSLKQGEPSIHAHIAIADNEGKAYRGYLMAGCIVSATFEVAILVYEDSI